MSNMWVYNGKKVKSHEDLHKDCTDIVYMITFEGGYLYIGKKTVRSTSTIPARKNPKGEVITRHILRDENGKIITSKKDRKEARARGLKAKAELYETVFTDKPFLKYKGSSDNTKDLKAVKKEILHQCSNKKTATYLEAYYLFAENVLQDDMYLNDNILGSFFDNSLEGLIDD